MAIESIVLAASELAASNLSSYQYHFVKRDTNGLVALSSNGGVSIGVLQDKPAAANAVCSVCRVGDRTKVVYGDAVTKGAAVSSDSTGRCIPAVSGDYILGYNGTQTGVTGEIGTILFQPMGRL